MIGYSSRANEMFCGTLFGRSHRYAVCVLFVRMCVSLLKVKYAAGGQTGRQGASVSISWANVILDIADFGLCADTTELADLMSMTYFGNEILKTPPITPPTQNTLAGMRTSWLP